MKLFNHLFLPALLFLTVAPAQAGTGASLKEVVATLELGYSALKDVQADFSQLSAIASMKREEKGAGELFIKRPAGGNAMFRFNYSKPQQQIVSNGKKLWYYIPENRQVMVGDLTALLEAGNGVTLNYLTGMGNVSRDFTVSFVGDGRDKNGNYMLELVPRKESQALAKLQLTVSGRSVEQFRATGKASDPFPIVLSVVYDQFGNKTTMEFSRVRVNRGMGNDLFIFKVPSGVEVVNSR
jgi:outer membrane lipoprotein carrier protein